MKKFSSVFIIFILVFSIFIIKIQTDPPVHSAAAILEEAFGTAGARVVSSEVYMQGRLDSRRVESTGERLLTELIAGAGGSVKSRKPVFSAIDTDLFAGFQTDYIIGPNSSVHADMLKEKREGGQADSRIVVSLINTSPEPELENSSASLAKTFANYGIKPSVNLRITGYVEGTLDKKRLEGLCDGILKSSGAKRVEGIDDNGLISVSAFSPSIDNTVKINGKRINLNVAVRYNSYENKTYIWLATPVITTEY